jgi:CO dehydrogenase maturation factor
LIVVEPSQSSLETAHRIQQLAADIGLSRLFVVGNKVRDAEERALIEQGMSDLKVLACLPESLALRQASRRGMPVQDPDLLAAVGSILEAIEGRSVVT